jgi:hypothetical protein
MSKEEASALRVKLANSIFVDLDGGFHMGNRWGNWYARSLAAGVERSLARLGMWAYRMSKERAWREDLVKECGWSDRGKAMLRLALKTPDRAFERWSYLLDTIGETKPYAGDSKKRSGAMYQCFVEKDWDNLDNVYRRIQKIKRNIRERFIEKYRSGDIEPLISSIENQLKGYAKESLPDPFQQEFEERKDDFAAIDVKLKISHVATAIAKDVSQHGWNSGWMKNKERIFQWKAQKRSKTKQKSSI